MTLLNRLCTLLCLILLFSCQPKQKPLEEAPAVAFNTTYKAPAFSETDRKQKVEGVTVIVDQIFKKLAKAKHFPGMVYGIVIDNQLVYSGAEGFTNIKANTKATSKSLFRIASMSKSFTAMAIMKLRDEGKLMLDDAVSTYIPEMGNITYLTEDAPVITIRNLLTMTAGFPEDNPWGDRQLADKPEELISFIKEGISFSNVPSREFEYSNIGYAMLGQIITKVSAVSYQKYITENILTPLGMTNTKWEYSEIDPALLALGYRWEDEQWKEEPLLHDGIYGAMGGLITSVEDFSKYVSFHLSAWPPRNGREEGPVKRSSLREMHKGWQFRGVDMMKDKRGQPCATLGAYGYGLGWRKDCAGVERVSHSGGLPGFGSDYRFYPEYGFGIICFANLTYASAGEVNGNVMDTLFALNTISKRVLPVSDTLQRRKEQVMDLLKSWDDNLEKKILAENFYPDLSKEAWMKKAADFFDATGKVIAVGELIPDNQLRGKFLIKGDKQDGEIFFTLTPEHSPKIQQLDLNLMAKQP